MGHFLFLQEQIKDIIILVATSVDHAKQRHKSTQQAMHYPPVVLDTGGGESVPINNHSTLFLSPRAITTHSHLPTFTIDLKRRCSSNKSLRATSSVTLQQGRAGRNGGTGCSSCPWPSAPPTSFIFLCYFIGAEFRPSCDELTLMLIRSCAASCRQ